MAWAFQRDSEFVECFNHHLQKMSEGGLLNRLERMIHNPEIKGKEGAIILGYENMAFPSFALLMGVVLALLLSIAEWLREKKRRITLAGPKTAGPPR